MTDSTDELIREIAAKHGIAIDRNDPILIMQTINKRLMEETQLAQEKMLVQFKEELEALSKRWSDDAKSRAERILNASLTAGRETMADALQQATQGARTTINTEITDLMVLFQARMVRSRNLAALNIIASLILLIAVCVLLWRAG